jgi:acetoacetyl-CoA synthetase
VGGPVTAGELLWTPSGERQARSRLARWMSAAPGGWAADLDGYQAAWEWSVADLDGFWRSVSEWAGVPWSTPPRRYFDGDPGAGAGPVAAGTWCGEGRLNYADIALAAGAGDQLAVVARSQSRGPEELTWAELAEQVGRARAGLRRAGVQVGDRVAAYLPNIPEALVAFLATASLGAVWTSCAPEMGVRGVLDRWGQVEPKVLLAVDGYRYGQRDIDRGAEVRQIAAGLPSLVQTVMVPYLSASPAADSGWWTWDQLLADPDDSAGGALAVEFGHPLYVLFSSGTTGKPKPIVHGHGGIVLEHVKMLALHHDLDAGGRLFWYTTTGWMMWNYLISALLVGSTAVLFDGDPNFPEPGALWGVMAETETTFGGMGAGYLVAGDKGGWRPGRDWDLAALSGVGSTGSPLPASAARWFYDAVGGDRALASVSGGTDVCTAFVGWSPLHPVWAGEISCRCLGAKVECFDDDGRPLVGEEGELVITAPLPSMPVGFWGDESGERYRASYFSRFDGVWAHGDRLTITSRRSCVITGRSDGTLNRGGVRLGTAEFYAVVEEFDEVADSLVVHVDDPGGGPGQLWLFVVAAEGVDVDDDLRRRLSSALRAALSPRHVPDRIVAVPGVPRTLSGKKLEVPVKRIFAGMPRDRALSVDAVANPEVLDVYMELASDT